MWSCDGEALADATGTAPPTVMATQVASATAERFVGRYHYAGGQEQRDALLAAIDEVVADMSVLTRGIARDRLRESNPVPSEISITRDAGSVTIALDDRKYTAPLDGSPTEVVGITGDTLQYRVTIATDRLEQSFVGPKGTRTNTHRVGDDGRLELRVVVDSDSLPKPLRYRLSFQRSS